MQKIMFNDKYGLTDAVLKGRKRMTRREPIFGNISKPNYGYYSEGANKGKLALCDGERIIHTSHYRMNEIVAVAESYETLATTGYLDKMMDTSTTFKREYCGVGWRNKMFVTANLMPHQIRITNVKVERLQDISNEDCLKEGVKRKFWSDGTCVGYIFDNMPEDIDEYNSPREALAVLIDKVSGKGTWKANPWVFAYEFELVR